MHGPLRQGLARLILVRVSQDPWSLLGLLSLEALKCEVVHVLRLLSLPMSLSELADSVGIVLIMFVVCLIAFVCMEDARW